MFRADAYPRAFRCGSTSDSRIRSRGATRRERPLLPRLPEWVDRDLFIIEARAEGNPTKDQMRLMMQSLLADRFRLRVHFETKELPVFALALVKPGTLGPKLLPHEQEPPCPASYTPSSAPPSGGSPPKEVFPPNCNTQEARARNGVIEVGGRNSTMPSLANLIDVLGSRAGEVDKPVVDRTGLAGAFDYTIVYTPGENGSPGPPDPNAPPPDPQGTPFLDAVRQQLGLKTGVIQRPNSKPGDRSRRKALAELTSHWVGFKPGGNTRPTFIPGRCRPSVAFRTHPA